ncbi:MAG TPA: amidase [Burkholderiales bacterium]|nr:amidase [Burkholderiales bacterium]
MNEIVANDTLNAFCRHTHIEVKGAGEGPLAGLTCAIKDIYDIAGQKTGFGSPDWLRTHEPATRTAPAVQLLLNAGADVIGKAHTEEMAWSLTGENAHYGTPVNIAAPGRIPGGSSSGSAAAVAAGLVDFALGSNTGGSVRVPASYCGILGLRPTHGRISLDAVCPLAASFDTCGWFARDPGVFERVGRVLLQDSAPAVQPRRLLLAQDAFACAEKAAAAALEPALDKVTALLGKPEAETVGDEPLAKWMDYFRFPQGAEAWAHHGEWVTKVRPQFGPGIRERFAWAQTLDPNTVAHARARREEITRRMDKLLDGAAVLVLPSAPGIAPLRNAPPKAVDEVRARALPMLCIAGIARLPQVSLPLATLDGCPLGLSLIAARGNDTMLLALAKRLLL